MKIFKAALTCALLALGAASGGHLVLAQAATPQFPDVPQNHWAYQAVMDLANKGYVQGYPDGKFMGNRAMTRYEFASVIARIVQTINGLSTQVGALQTPTGTPVTQDDLNKIQALVDTFQPQLTTIQAQIGNIDTELDTLRQDVADAQKTAHKALDTANQAYSSNPKSKFNISGFFQARYEAVGTGSESLYPQGKAFSNSAATGDDNFGNNSMGFMVRRARIAFNGSPTANTTYQVQVDTSGPNAAANPVSLRSAFGAYTFGDGDPAKNLTLTAGQFANPFGYELSASSTAIISPERPLGFNENGYGIWNGEDYVVGAQAAYNIHEKLLFIPSGLNISVSTVNPNGRNSDNTTRHIDSIYRVKYQTPNKVLGFGASYYDGEVTSASDVSAAPTGAGVNTFPQAKKQIYGLDGQIHTHAGIFLNAEYEAGLYETRTYLNAADALVSDDYVKGNQMSAYYVQGGWTYDQTGVHPLTVAASYDALYRSHSGEANGADDFGVAGNTAAGGSSYDDSEVGYRILYNFDKATRIRLWYEQPFEVAHEAGTPEPQRVGLFTSELQYKF